MSLIWDIDAAVAANLQHGAMALADPGTESLYGQLEAPAAEGAAKPVPYTAGLTPAQREQLQRDLDEARRDPWLTFAVPLAFALGAALSALWPWGVA